MKWSKHLSAIFALSATVLLSSCSQTLAVKGKIDAVTTESGSYDIYVPYNFDESKHHELLVGLSPDGNTNTVIGPWAEACDKKQFVMVAPKDYSPGADFSTVADKIIGAMNGTESKYRINNQLVYAVGQGESVAGAFFLTQMHPERIRGIIANSAPMPYGKDAEHPLPGDFPAQKLCAFLFNVKDTNIADMRNSRSTLGQLGWKTAWIEFKGNPGWAPPEKCIEALDWISRTK